MHRSLSRTPFRLIADSFCRSNLPQNGQKNVTQRIQYLKTISEGHGGFCYGAESVTSSLQMQIVNALRFGERDRASNLLSNLSNGSESLRDDDFVYILDYCAKSPDPLFVLETWRVMMEKEIGMKKRCYMFVIQALTKGGYLEEALNWLTFLGEKPHTNPVLPMYNTFLNGCARMQSMAHADHCLDLMESRLIGKSEVTYGELLKLAVWQQNLTAAHEIWKEFTKYYSPSIMSLRKFIWSFTRLGDLVSACEALQHLVVLAFQGSDSLKRSAEGKYQSSRLDIPIPSISDFDVNRSRRMENGNSVPSLLFDGTSATTGEDELRSIQMDIDSETEPVLKMLRWSFSDVIHACAQSRNCELAERLFLQMHNLGLEPSCHTYDGFIRAVVLERGVTDGMKVLKAMEKKNLKPYNATLATLSIGCSKILELDLAEALLDQIVESPYLHPFNALLAACDVMDQPERAIRVVAKMKQMKLKSDIRTYELLFSLFGHVNAPYEKGNRLSQIDAAKRIKAIEMDMMKSGVQHSHRSMENLLKSLGAEGMIRELIEYLHVAENQLCRTNTYPGTAMYNTVLHSLVEAKESHMAIEVFKTMKVCELPPDAATYNIMVDCCSIIRCFKSACALVSMMIRDGFLPETCTYTALIKILLANEDFDEAWSLLDQLSLEGIQPDVLLFNTILLEAYLKGRIDIIELIVERMHREKIQPDPTTCSYVFTAYVDCGFLSTAMEALQVLSMRMISEEEHVLEEKRKDLEEDFILAEDSEAELRIIEFFKDSQENLAAALLNLRWSELAGFSISWLPNESVWARRLSSSYCPRKELDEKSKV
ncbi:Pentatricopeptide repeat [Macleaya cordata]|uniref:Pentatricopeptide repeat n=1 Tax=Macleaya cordata TaxID=56857 RepID=A0A200QNE8_MACCD|nr:Pentatricopeptide repeat [Macleaya cordata]